jgi:hypothetical protein
MEIDTEVCIARIYFGFFITIFGRLFLWASENYHRFTECVPVCGYLGYEIFYADFFELRQYFYFVVLIMSASV